MSARLIATSALGVLIQASPALAGSERYGMMWGGWFHMFFGFLLMILLLGIIVALFVVIALIACLVPARRAASLDPANALRSE